MRSLRRLMSLVTPFIAPSFYRLQRGCDAMLHSVYRCVILGARNRSVR